MGDFYSTFEIKNVFKSAVIYLMIHWKQQFCYISESCDFYQILSKLLP